MSPRRYRMAVRADAVSATRHRIVEAAMELHSEYGTIDTGWDDIARRAGVSTATVYRHFPSLAELVPACAESVFQVAGLPTPEQAEQIFVGATSPVARMERLIRGTCDCYARAGGWLHAARREQDLVSALRAAVEVQEKSVEVLVRSAVGSKLSDRTIRVLVALVDFPFWKSLKDAGFSDRAATDVVIDLVKERLAKEAKA